MTYVAVLQKLAHHLLRHPLLQQEMVQQIQDVASLAFVQIW